MSQTNDAIDQLFSFTLNGIAYTVEIAGKLAPEIAKFFMGLTHQGTRTKGEIKLHNLLRRGEGLEVMNLREQDFSRFQEAANKSGLLYSTVCLDDSHRTGERLFTVYFGARDMALVNNILDVTQVNTVKAASFRTVEERAVEQPGQEQAQGHFIERFIGEDGEFANPAQPKIVKNPVPIRPESRKGSLSGNGSGPCNAGKADGRVPIREQLARARESMEKEKAAEITRAIQASMER